MKSYRIFTYGSEYYDIIAVDIMEAINKCIEQNNWVEINQICIVRELSE